ELHVGSRTIIAGAREAARLVDGEAQRAAAGEEVLQAGGELAVPRAELLVERGHARAVEVVDAQVILQVRADGRRVEHDIDAVASQQRAGADAGALQELRRVDGTGGEDDLLARDGLERSVAAPPADGRR